jgi:hypothetical protein
MAIWLLRQLNEPERDEAEGFVVRARSEPRALVAGSVKDDIAIGDEGADCWLDKRRSQCVRLESNGPVAVFLRSFTPAVGKAG